MKICLKKTNKKLRQKLKVYSVNILKLSEDKAKLCQKDLIEKDSYDTLICM